MIVEPIQIRQITVSTDHIYGIDDNGQVWFRKRLPTPAYHTSTASEKKKKEEEEEEEAKKLWKKLCMNGRIAGTELPPSKDIPPEITGPPVDAKPENAVAPSAQDDEDGIDFGAFGGLARFCHEGFPE